MWQKSGDSVSSQSKAEEEQVEHEFSFSDDDSQHAGKGVLKCSPYGINIHLYICIHSKGEESVPPCEDSGHEYLPERPSQDLDTDECDSVSVCLNHLHVHVNTECVSYYIHMYQYYLNCVQL